MPRKVQDRGLYLRESLERTSDLLLMEESFVYTLLRSTRSASTSLCLFFPPPVCVLRHMALFPSAPITYCPFFLPHLPFPSLLSSCSALLYLTGRSLRIPQAASQVKLLIASAAGGEELELTAAQLVPVQGREGGWL